MPDGSPVARVTTESGVCNRSTGIESRLAALPKRRQLFYGGVIGRMPGPGSEVASGANCGHRRLICFAAGGGDRSRGGLQAVPNSLSKRSESLARACFGVCPCPHGDPIKMAKWQERRGDPLTNSGHPFNVPASTFISATAHACFHAVFLRLLSIAPRAVPRRAAVVWRTG